MLKEDGIKLQDDDDLRAFDRCRMNLKRGRNANGT